MGLGYFEISPDGPAYRYGLCFGEHRCPDIFASCSPALPDSVHLVLEMRANEQMHWIDAGRVITPMTGHFIGHQFSWSTRK